MSNIESRIRRKNWRNNTYQSTTLNRPPADEQDRHVMFVEHICLHYDVRTYGRRVSTNTFHTSDSIKVVETLGYTLKQQLRVLRRESFGRQARETFTFEFIDSLAGSRARSAVRRGRLPGLGPLGSSRRGAAVLVDVGGQLAAGARRAARARPARARRRAGWRPSRRCRRAPAT